MKCKFLAMLAAGFILSGAAILAAQNEAKKEFPAAPTPLAVALQKEGQEAAQGKAYKEFPAPSAPSGREAAEPKAEAAAAFTGSQFGWIAPNGTWDGKGLFHYRLGNNFWVAKASQYAEDANYCYYQETTTTSWWWALARNPTGGQHYIYVRAGSGGFTVFSSIGAKLTRVGDNYP